MTTEIYRYMQAIQLGMMNAGTVRAASQSYGNES